ncbi:MAG: prolyl oligopeptidase family serine peptidase [bacterium]|nr:prolyl oligopeptidase family serine peptidase [bacterium]
MPSALRSALVSALCAAGLIAASVGLVPIVHAADASKAEAVKSIDEELTLERIFPEDSPFGPGASSMAFSHDGRYAAYLYRPRIERRHGNDLWLYDAETGAIERVTSVSVLAPFQADTREVAKDRRERAKKAGKGEKSSDNTGGVNESADDPLLGNWSGRVRGSALPDGVDATVTISKSDNSYSARVTSALFDLSSTSVEFDNEQGTLRMELATDEDAARELTGSFDGTLGDGGLSGALTLDPLGWELELTATRDASEANDDSGSGSEAGGDTDLADLVLEDDHEHRGPRYSGVSSFEWSPMKNEMIFNSRGDLYRFDIDSREIERLTMTRGSLRDVQYLPDGSGYTYLNDGALIRVKFGSHTMVQLDPDLPRGQSMSGYRISPDGKRLVFLATSGSGYYAGARTVNIISYRNRFAEVRQVTRHVSDDQRPDLETFVYLHELDPDLTEKTEPKMVYSRKQSGPRDIMIVPDWAPDSSRVAFSVFDQETSQVKIMEARFVEKQDDEAPEESASEDDAEESIDSEEGGDDESPDAGDGESDASEEDRPEFEIEEARVVYEFFHNGGPNTPRMVVPTYLPDSRRMVFLTELSGFRHLHTLDPVYEQLEQLTSGRFEVYPVDVTRDHTSMLALATKGDPTQQQVFRVDLTTGEMTRVSPEDGYYSSPAMSPDGENYLASFVDFGTLRELVAYEHDSEEHVTITDSHTDEARAITEPSPEYFTYENRHGQTIHGHMFLPPGYDEAQQRPLLVYVYGGPLGTRKMTSRGSFAAPSYYFAYYMAKKHGYITATIDPRGASGFGAVFEKANFEQVGVPQTEDLVDGAEWFVENYNVDPKRRAMHGWSFGGFQTQMVMYTEPDVFSAGMAGAGPTEWENYNSWYSTGTIGDSRIGNPDLKAYSLLPLAKNLTGQLLLVHGVEDANVLYQDTIRVYRELLKAGKEAQVELFIDPTGGHGLGGDVKTINRYRKYESFLLRTIGHFENPETEAEAETEVEEVIEEEMAEEEVVDEDMVEELIP